MMKPRHDERNKKFNLYVEQHVGEYAKQLNKVIVTMDNFDMPTKFSSSSLHEALKSYDTKVREVMVEVGPFQLMDTRTFTLVFEEWIVYFVLTLRAALHPAALPR